jgi:uncharacterized repeat protein (TIGR02543 family)
VTFDALGGTPVETQTIDDNGLATDVDTEKTGHTFGGWYTSVDLGVTLGDAWDFSTLITQDMILYAKWTINTYTITYVLSGGSFTAPANVVYGNQTVAPSNPTRFGYTFSGWYLENTFTTQYNFNEPMPAQSFSLFAKWTPVVSTITFNSNGGTEVSPITQNYLTPITWPANPERADSLFAGWYANTAFTGSPSSITTMPANSFNLYAKYFRLFERIHVGSNFSFGVAESGNIYAWGTNTNKQLGNGVGLTASKVVTPTLFTISSLNEGETIEEIIPSQVGVYAMTSEGRVFVWGSTQVGSYNTPTVYTMAGLNANESITKIFASSLAGHAFFYTSEHRLFASGANIEGQLGKGNSGPFSSISTPEEITLPNLQVGETVVNIALGRSFTIVQTNMNRLYGFGRNLEGMAGDGTGSGNQTTPKLIDMTFLGSDTITSIKAGYAFTYLKTSSDQYYIWGDGDEGVFGNGTTTNVLAPTLITYAFMDEGDDILDIFPGSNSTYALTTLGKIYAWGFGGQGALGPNLASNTPVPIPVSGLNVGEKVVRLSASSGPVIHAITSENRTLSWGRGIDGQIGDGDTNMFTASAVKTSPIFI